MRVRRGIFSPEPVPRDARSVVRDFSRPARVLQSVRPASYARLGSTEKSTQAQEMRTVKTAMLGISAELAPNNVQLATQAGTQTLRQRETAHRLTTAAQASLALPRPQAVLLQFVKVVMQANTSHLQRRLRANGVSQGSSLLAQTQLLALTLVRVHADQGSLESRERRALARRRAATALRVGTRRAPPRASAKHVRRGCSYRWLLRPNAMAAAYVLPAGTLKQQLSRHQRRNALHVPPASTRH